MGNAFWFEWEPQVILFLQDKITPILQSIFEAITFLGDEYAMILIIGFLYWGYKKDLGKKVGIYAIMALVSSIALNNIVMRRRPYFDHPEIKCLKPRSSEGDPYDLLIQGFSFPSGHATNSISTYAVLGLNSRKKILKAVFFFIPILIGLSRVTLGVHYPTDILAGWALSALIIFIVSFIKNQYALYILITVLGMIGCFFCKSADYYSALGITFGFILGFLFEEKKVHFENTKSVLWMIIRTVGGLFLFVAVDKLLKIPFSAEFLSSATSLALLVRTIRYTLATFVLIGVYPLSFQWIDKKISKKHS